LRVEVERKGKLDMGGAARRVVSAGWTPRDLLRGTAKICAAGEPPVVAEIGEDVAGPARVQS
jgi:hypothetical protein